MRRGAARSASRGRKYLINRKKALATTARQSKFAKARALPSRTALSNKRAINLLRQQQFGPIQVQQSLSHDSVVPTAEHPILFCASNVQCGNPNGCKIYRVNESVSNKIQKETFFTESTGFKFQQQDSQNIANGPRMLLLEAEFQFKLRGFLQNTHVRIDFIRQKKTITGEYWSPQTNVNWMPHNADGFKELAGFTANAIDTRIFEVLATRKIYFNSMGSANTADGIEDRNTTEATTAPQKLVTMSLKFKGGKIIKQLESSRNNLTAADSADLDAHNEDGNLSKGSYDFDNVHPLSNVWCLISTDDTTDLAEIVTGEELTVDIIRKYKWRDTLA